MQWKKRVKKSQEKFIFLFHKLRPTRLKSFSYLNKLLLETPRIPHLNSENSSGPESLMTSFGSWARSRIPESNYISHNPAEPIWRPVWSKLQSPQSSELSLALRFRKFLRSFPSSLSIFGAVEQGREGRGVWLCDHFFRLPPLRPSLRFPPRHVGPECPEVHHLRGPSQPLRGGPGEGEWSPAA